MAEKKRKVSTPNTAQAAKKAKQIGKIDAEPAALPVPVKKTKALGSPADGESNSTRKPRKRAADFLDDEADATPPKKGKKSASASKVAQSASLTADGTNGVIEHVGDEDVTITTTKKSTKKSMMAEAADTQDHELADEFGDESKDKEAEEEIDAAPALLTGFDSDNDDPAEDKNFDGSRLAPLPQFKKTSKKLRQAKEKGKGDGPGVVYVGRIPHGFYESQMREYFEQFGTIARLRLSRNKKTGASKHFAFIEFENDEVAKIVAETMDNYLMFGHILRCKHAPQGSLHEDVWKGANRRYRRIPHHKLLKQQAEEPRTEEQIAKKMGKEQRKRQAKKEKLKGLGYDYELPELKKPELNGQEVIEEAKDTEVAPLAIEDKVEGAILPPANVPKDELAVKVEEKLKKSKKGKKSEVITPVADKAATIPNDVVADNKKVKKSKKAAEEVENTTEVQKDQNPKGKKAKVDADATNDKTKLAGESKQLKGILKKPKAKRLVS